MQRPWTSFCDGTHLIFRRRQWPTLCVSFETRGVGHSMGGITACNRRPMVSQLISPSLSSSILCRSTCLLRGLLRVSLRRPDDRRRYRPSQLGTLPRNARIVHSRRCMGRHGIAGQVTRWCHVHVGAVRRRRGVLVCHDVCHELPSWHGRRYGRAL
jgi:hypothetical protein